MTAPEQEKAASKVIAKASNWADRRKTVQRPPPGSTKAREAGRYEAAGNQLAEACAAYEKCRGGQS